MRKYIVTIIFFLSFFLSVGLFSASVSFEDAQRVADNWIGLMESHLGVRVMVVGGETVTREKTVVGYVFHLSPKGYLIVSPEDYLPPVKLYSLENNYGEEGRLLEGHIFRQNRKILTRAASGHIDPRRLFSPRNRGLFERLKKEPGSAPGQVMPIEEMAPLLSTTWGQRLPYNLRCPVVEEGACPTGCVATALSQLMKFFSYPNSGRYSKRYQTFTHELDLSASFDHPYRWDLMLDNYGDESSATDEQFEAVAQLMFDVGVAMDMDYKPGGSGAYTIHSIGSLPYYFNYSKEMLYVTRLGKSDDQWFSLAREHLDRGYPLPFRILGDVGGHLTIVDGYRVIDGAVTFHLNMGWDGNWNGYFALDNIVVREDDPLDFTDVEKQAFVLKMVPPERADLLPEYEVGGTVSIDRSLFLFRYYCTITWEGVPGAVDRIAKYYVVARHTGTGEEHWLAEIPHTGQSSLYSYTFTSLDFDSHTYFIVGVTVEEEDFWVLGCNLVLK